MPPRVATGFRRRRCAAVLALAVVLALPATLDRAGDSPAFASGPVAAASPSLRAAVAAATPGRRRSLSFRIGRRVSAGNVLLAGVAVRGLRPRAIDTPDGWRLVRTDRTRGLAQALYLRVAVGGEPDAYTWRFPRAAAAAGGVLAYRGVSATRPLAASAGAAAASLRARRRLVGARGLRVTVAGARVVGFFATAGRRRLAAPRGMRRRYAARSRRASVAAFDLTKRRAGATGGRPAVARCMARSRCRVVPAVGRLIALRPASPPSGTPPGAEPPGRPPRARLPSPLPESTGQRFYVSTTGSDSGPGTAAAPWRTLQKAADTLAPGQKALVRGGVYVENLNVDRSGTASAPISIEADEGEVPILRSAGGHPVEISSDGGWFRLRGLTIERSPGTSGGNVDVYGHHVEISSNEIREGRDQGIYTAEESRAVYIIGNWIHHNGEGIAHQSHGIYLQGADHLVSTNVIHDHPEGFGIQVYDENRDSTVVSNTVVRSGLSGIVIGGAGGVSGIRVHNNVFAFNDQWGIKHDSDCPSSSVADHNVIWANGYEPIEEGCSGLDTSGGNVFADPRFVDLDARNLHLSPGSAALDQGLPEWTLGGDFDGEPRPQGAAPDDGAFEDG